MRGMLTDAAAAGMQIADAVWMSMLLSAFAGVLAVTVVVATFYFIRYLTNAEWYSPCGPDVPRHIAEHRWSKAACSC